MSKDINPVSTSPSHPMTSASTLFAVGSELFQEVQQIVGKDRVRSLRLTLGGRPIKDIPVTATTTIATIALVILAVIITNLKIEVIKTPDPSTSPAAPKSSRSGRSLVITTLLSGELSERLRQSQLRYGEMTDYEVVDRAQRGEDAASEFLLYKYRNLVRTRIKPYFIVGAEKEDLLQVGMIGLWQAIIDFRPERAFSFPAFAKVCITRHIITAIKTATRQKQMPLNRSLSLESPSEDTTSDWNLSDVIPGTVNCDPEEMVLRHEDTKILHETLQQVLSEFEWYVLSGYRLGKSYREIAIELTCKTKSVDNALARIRRKVSGVPLGNADLCNLL